ncbi:MAG: hypothetical protein R6W72_08440 [Desulfurivibrionaceae bacterium]
MMPAQKIRCATAFIELSLPKANLRLWLDLKFMFCGTHPVELEYLIPAILELVTVGMQARVSSTTPAYLRIFQSDMLGREFGKDR